MSFELTTWIGLVEVRFGPAMRDPVITTSSITGAVFCVAGGRLCQRRASETQDADEPSARATTAFIGMISSFDSFQHGAGPVAARRNRSDSQVVPATQQARAERLTA